MRFSVFLLCVCELLLVTYARNFAGPLISPLLLLLVSLSIAVLFLRSSNKPVNSNVSTIFSAELTANIYVAQIIAFSAVSFYIFYLLTKCWGTYEISMNAVDQCDVIPQNMYLVKRFLAGQQPYVPITAWGYSMFPTYLPFQWLPYVIAEKLKIDYRWIPAGLLWLTCLYFFIKNFSFQFTGINDVWKCILPTYPLIVWIVLIKSDTYTFVVTVEELVAAYYLFVAASIGNKRVVALGTGIALCLLSRYSIIFWVPVCVYCLYLSGLKRQVLSIVITITLFFILFYWLPFLRVDPHIFYKGYQYHTAAALYDWGFGNYLFNGLGFASWVIKFYHDTTEHRLFLYQRIHIVLCILAMLFCMVYYSLKRPKYATKDYLLFSLKVCITVFYSFIQTPYSYLYMVPVIISSALLINMHHFKQFSFKQLKF